MSAFKACTGPAHLPFILGVTNHWVFSLATKSPCSGQGAKVSLLYLDSGNVAVVGASAADLAHITQQKERKYVKLKGRGYSDWERSVVYQAFADQRDVLLLLARCLVGQVELPAALLCGHWTRLLHSYQEHVTKHHDDETVLLLQWLEREHHPLSMRDCQLELLKRLDAKVMGEELRERATEWVKGCQRQLGDEYTGLEAMEQFRTVLIESATLLAVGTE